MYINKLDINSFGCFTDRTFEFSEGLNVLYGLNESGKSTVFSFMVFMLYGTKVKKEPGDLSFKEKHMPWNGKPMQGRMEFVAENTVYSLERLCASSRNVVRLFCITTGEEITDRSIVNNIGEYFLGVNVQSFCNTCYIQGSSDILHSMDEILAKLTSVSENGVEDVSYNRIMDKLNEEILELTSAKRKNSIIPNLQKTISDATRKKLALENDLEDIEFIDKENITLQNNINRICSEISDIQIQNRDITSYGKPPKPYFKFLVPMALILLGICICFFKITLTTVVISLVAFFIGVVLFAKTTGELRKDFGAEKTNLFTLQKNNDKILSLSKEQTNIQSQIAVNNERRKNIVAKTDEYSAVVSELKTLNNKLSDSIQRLEALELAKSALSQAYSEFKKVFSPGLSALSAEIFSVFTGNNNRLMLVDDKFSISVDEMFGYKSASALSTGTNQQAYLAMRLALCKIVLSDSAVPIFLDDALAYYDNERLCTTINYLVGMSKNCQVFFSTCRNDELDILKSETESILYI